MRLLFRQSTKQGTLFGKPLHQVARVPPVKILDLEPGTDGTTYQAPGARVGWLGAESCPCRDRHLRFLALQYARTQAPFLITADPKKVNRQTATRMVIQDFITFQAV